MSLINQMLQDLDKRRSQMAGEGTMHGQIRAVPERTGIGAPSAWWVALAVAIAATGGVAWLGMRQVAPVAVPQSVAQPLAQPVVAVMKPASSLSEVPMPTPGKMARKRVSEPLSASSPLAADVMQATGTKDAARKTENGLPPPSADEKVAAAAPSQAVPGPSVAINKQMKELTPQQRSENEYRKAVSLMQQGRVRETVSGLEAALQLDPQHVAARQTLVGLLVEDKRSGDAMRWLQDGLNLDASQSGMAMIMARLQVENGDAGAAVETLQRTLPYASDRADYQAFLAAVLQRQGRHQEAVDHYMQALRKSPQTGIWWMGLGISLQAENRAQDAQNAFGRAKASNALSPELKAFVEQKLKELQH